MSARMATFLVVLLACSWVMATDANPGISLRLNQEFFNFMLRSEIEPLIKEKLGPVRPAPVKFHIGTVNIDMTLSEITLYPSTFGFAPETVLTPNNQTNSLEIVVGFYMLAKAHYHTRSRVWPHISASGTLTAYFRPLWVALDMSMSPGAGGLWEFAVTKLLINSNCKLSFTGPIKLLNIGAIESYINSKANEEISNALHAAISENLAKITPMMKKYLPYLNYPKCADHGLPPACQNFAVDLALYSSGIWHPHCYAELQFDGFVVYDKKPYIPSGAPAFPPIAGECGDHHVSVLLSGGFFTSAVNAIFGSGLININVRSGKFADDAMYHDFIPEMAKMFGHDPLFFNLTLRKAQFELIGGKIATNILVQLEILADTTPERRTDPIYKEAFTMTVNVTVALTTWIKPLQTAGGMFDVVYMNFSTAAVNNVTILHSAFYVDDASVQKLLQTMMNDGFRNADKLLASGAVIIPPEIGKFSIRKPELVIANGYLKIATNVDLDPVVNGTKSNHDNLADALEEYIETFKDAATQVLAEAQSSFLNFMVKAFTI